ncbi:LysR family transcriptional regulator [Thermosynechococcaceae cyanobacterium BACA0444]|uniref:LysR family transcriptional regulator n=1 Tax=Pseudocalidococcus azoricus BACA0444 TaxID=2918990 RepID=A0AAE4FUW6_9CYAN|nr:LysR family transcriptional regulator [Pseudocalidococcus azoricus]MDS3862313.1 LysR family transcriptional regulator [Pseudocalidococcus azoricus BACA0444]
MKSIKLANIDLNLLIAFEALYHEQSVTLAAQRLNVGQPAMSSALGRLRLIFEDELFIRIGRQMRPTATAQAIAPKLINALEMIREALQEQQLFDPATDQRAFTIAAPDYLSNLIVPKILDVLTLKAPNIDLRLITVQKESCFNLLAEGVVDCVLGTFEDVPNHFFQESLFFEGFMGICQANHPAIDCMDLAHFVQFPHALFTLRRDATGAIDQALAEYGLRRRILLTTPYWFILPAVIATSDILTAVPTCFSRHLLDNYALASFEIPLDLPSWSVSMVWHQLQDQDVASHWLRQVIQRVCRENFINIS